MGHHRRNNRIVLLGTALGCLLAFSAVLPALAQAPDLGLEYATATGLGTTDIRTTVSTIIRAFLGLLGITAVVIILYAGFLWMTAGGSEERVTAAKKWMVNGVIGLIIILSAYAIVSFIFRAATGVGEGGGFGAGDCPPGQNCVTGLGGSPPGGFEVRSMLPEGAGPGGGGYPKNSSVRIKFSAAVEESSVKNKESFKMWRCNPRIDGSGAAQAFDEDACDDQPVDGLPFTFESNLVTFTPSTPCEERPDLFCLDGDHWYFVALESTITNTSGTSLPCPVIPAGPTGEFWTSAAQDNLCERAFAVNNSIDTEPPTVRISTPKSPPNYCEDKISVQAIIEDDSYPTVARFRLQDPEGNDVNAFIYALDNAPHDGIVTNPEDPDDPDDTPREFSADELAIATAGLVPDTTYTLIAVAEDTVPNVSSPVQRSFKLNSLQCCNGVMDDPPETGIDCGPNGVCGGDCVGAPCTDDSQCASGSCMDGFCVERPIIESVTTTIMPPQGGPGTLVTLTGKFFGDPGGVIFMGDPLDPDDDVQAQACAEQAWTLGDDNKTYTVTVSVPEGASDGPLELVNSRGLSDDTTAETSGVVVSFDVTDDPPPPGICYLDPNAGTAGASFTIHGIGFGETQAAGSFVSMGTNAVSVRGGDGGWSDIAIDAFAPSTREGIYPVTVTVSNASGTVATNPIYFSLRPEAGEETPRIDEIIPASGPIGSYVTLIGAGFGSRTGVVRFIYEAGGFEDEEVAIGDTPACDDNWKRNSIIIKVPEIYQSGSIMNRTGHLVEVESAGGISKKSNRVAFTINSDTRGPGLCSIRPDNGPPGMQVQVIGEGFGSGPASTVVLEPFSVSSPRNTLDFPASDADAMPSVNYGPWLPGSVTAVVPGTRSVRSTWPASGSVFVTADDNRSSNAVRFSVQDCNESGCPIGSVCCANGSCDVPEAGQAACQPPSRGSAYGWRLSTMTLPSLPQVVEQNCSATVLQSPSPARSSTDACVNTYIQVQFTKTMDQGSFQLPDDAEKAPPATVIVQECGSDDAGPACPTNETDAVLDGAFKFPAATPGDQTVMRFTPPSNFAQDTWYRVTLVSRPNATIPAGLVEAGTGRYLDGDRDNRQGGDYAFTFRTRDSTTACELDHVTVSPAIATIDHQGDPREIRTAKPPGFAATLVAANCNPIRCEVRTNEDPEPATYDYFYSIGWTSVQPQSELEPVLELDQLQSGYCLENMSVAARRETTGFSVTMTASATPKDGGLTREGDADIKVKFADPYVVDHAPNCAQACVNAGVRASFNVPMNASLFTGENIKVVKCRNASCNPPFGADQPSIGIDSDFDTRDGRVYGFAAYAAGGFVPSTYYRVRLVGGDGGIMSASGVPLTRLNDSDAAGKYFTWTFRTKDDGNPCEMSSASITPPSVALQYVGDRRALTAVPRGAPDECDAKGQVLDPRSYNWQWEDETDNGVVDGFIDPRVFRPPLHQFGDGRLDTAATAFPGCTDRCTLAGSQNVKPQCGNGKVERGEQCDINLFGDFSANGVAVGAWPPNCGKQTCLWLGTALESEGGTCGNETIEFNETCDFAGGVPGCLEPGAGELGCVVTGADTVSGAMCGDGAIGDGEDCDDGNGSNGDGCSSECLAEGTLRSCAVTDGACVNFCGNGIDEPGEDPACDNAALAGTVPSFCDRATCTKKGSDPVAAGGTCGIDGDGDGDLLDPREECDPGQDGAPWCTSRCLYAGSSWQYDEPSFCGDGIWGYGESPLCDGDDVTPDDNIDPFQVIVAGSYSGESEARAEVTASAGNIVEEQFGRADVTLSCVCDEQAEPQDYCAEIDSPQPLGCDMNGCCAPAPIVTSKFPTDGSGGQCRNTGVRIVFDTVMDRNTAERIALAEAEPDVGCDEPEDLITTGVSVSAVHDQDEGWFARLAKSVWEFFRSVFARIVNAQSVPSRFCRLDTIVTVTGETVRLAPTNALAPNAWHLVLVPGGENGVFAENGVPLGADTKFNFMTGPEVCAIESVGVEPESDFFSTADVEEREFVAVAHPDMGEETAEIVSVPEYSFKWRWHLLPDTSGFEVVPSLQAPVTWNGYCEDGEPVTSGDCSVDLTAASEPKPPPGCPVGLGNGVCEADTDEHDATSDDYCPEDCAVEPGHGAVALVKVRASEAGNAAVAAKEVIRVSAETSDRRVVKNSIECDLDPLTEPNCAEVTAMLCDNPWPARLDCQLVSGAWKVRIPWTGQYEDCATPLEGVWYPFWDDQTDVSFFYCRDGGAGDNGDTLPALSDTITRILHDPATTGLLREYLFTFNDPGKLWSQDAVGVRFATNPMHRNLTDWYADRGFRGAPASIEIGGYEALQDGRTAYVNAAAVTSSGIFTNVNVLSFTDGAQPETTAIFNQILANIDFNRSVSDSGYCVDPSGEQILVDANGERVNSSIRGGPVSCNADVECRVRGDGSVYTGGGSWYCRAPQSKLQRDVLRLGGLLKTRDDLLRVGQGSYPRLLAGTFLPALSTSVWASWDSVLSEEAGILLAKDPVNRYSPCLDAGYEPGSCWNQSDQEYMCPAGSQVYEYQGLGGQDFIISGSLETACAGLPDAICSEAPWCEFIQGLGTGYIGSDWPDYEWPWMPDRLCKQYGACTYETAFVEACRIWGHLFPDCGTPPYDPDGRWAGRYAFCARDGSTTDYLCRDYYLAGPSGCQATANTWAGSTCLEITRVEDCTGDCIWESGQCQFEDGKIKLAGMPSHPAPICEGNTVGASLVCGDGRVTGEDDDCEPGQTQAVACSEDDDGYAGTAIRRCNEVCDWVEPITPQDCTYGSCGDGVVQSNEQCDDGALNGTYGNCGSNCTRGALVSTYCGDGVKQPVEACDCGAQNGTYFFNGILATDVQPGVGGATACGTFVSGTGTPSCSWDCAAPGPRCGDGIVNNIEVCDGGVQTFKGYCNDSAETGCDTNADCPGGSTCGNFCGDPNDPLDPRRNRRACNTNSVAGDGDDIGATRPSTPTSYGKACMWSAWTCTGAGSCGNGVLETGEECDEVETDGPTGEAGECVMHTGVYECKLNRCGDGYVYGAGGEECDEAAENGQICNPLYDRSCTYCTESCKVRTVTGGFCGNGLLEPPPKGPEECDGAFGFEGTWSCVSDRPEHKSWGLYTGAALCSASSCTISCADPYSIPCRNESTATNTDKGTGTNPDRRTNYSNSFYDEDDFIFHAPTQVPLSNSCDPDDDGDGVPDNSRAECGNGRLDPETHGEYTYPYYGVDHETGQPLPDPITIHIPAAFEKCDGVDNDCNGLIDDSYPVDMVFSIDASGSMGGEMLAVAEALAQFADEFVGSQHRFGFVIVGQSVSNSLVTYANDTIFWHDLTDAEQFIDAINDMDLTATKGGTEPMHASVMALAGWSDSPLVNPTLDYSNVYNLSWRDGQPEYDNVNARRFVVVVTDETGNDLTDRSDTPADVAAAIADCRGRCGPDSRVNVFAITGHASRWYLGTTNSIVLEAQDTYPVAGSSGSLSCTLPAAVTSATYCPEGASAKRNHCTVTGTTTTPAQTCTYDNLTTPYRTWLRDIPFEEVCPWVPV